MGGVVEWRCQKECGFQYEKRMGERRPQGLHCRLRMLMSQSGLRQKLRQEKL
jgi:hypothetical protein